MSRRLSHPARIRAKLSGGRPLLPAILDDVVVEQACRRPAESQRVAIFAHYSPSAAVSRSVNTYLMALADHGYDLLVVSAAPAAAALVFDARLTGRLTVLRKPNLGYDFGSWAVGLAWAPQLARADNVVMTNDSLAGPFAPLTPLLEGFERTHADVYALTDNSQFEYHLQSFFLGFRAGALTELPLQRFWSGIRHEEDKQRIVLRNEVGLSRLLRREGFSSEVAIPYASVVTEWRNPTIIGWSGLLEKGFPFVKRELLRRPDLAPDGDRVPATVREKYGVSIEEWL